ncbi:hypothetical protein NOZE110980_18315 [Nocardioides zeicaulis]
MALSVIAASVGWVPRLCSTQGPVSAVPPLTATRGAYLRVMWLGLNRPSTGPPDRLLMPASSLAVVTER